jgi:DNA-binding transcriptional LysR family regulator
MPIIDTRLSMKVFRQVVESGTFVEAAERLSLSTAMTSKHLMHLEKHLGTRLINRSSRSLSLTESGKLFFERCRAILEDVDEAELVVGSVSGVPSGTLRVTAPSWFATRGMVDLVAAYRQRYPEVVVDLSFEDRFVDLRNICGDAVFRNLRKLIEKSRISQPWEDAVTVEETRSFNGTPVVALA